MPLHVPKDSQELIAENKAYEAAAKDLCPKAMDEEPMDLTMSKGKAAKDTSNEPLLKKKKRVKKAKRPVGEDELKRYKAMIDQVVAQSYDFDGLD